MFGATALRRKREREQREKAARGLEPRVFPYIKPFGKKFDKNQLPYFKYRHAFQKMETLKVGLLQSFDYFYEYKYAFLIVRYQYHQRDSLQYFQQGR